MAATALVREVLARASFLLVDTKPQFTRFAERDMVDALNDAQVAIAKYLPAACSRLAALRLQPGTRQSIDTIAAADCKPADGPAPTLPVYGKQLLDVVRYMGADGITPGRAILPTSRKLLDATDSAWHTKTGVPSAFTFDPREPRYFYVSPGVPAAGAWAEVLFTAAPSRIPAGGAQGAEIYGVSGASTATIGIDDEHVDDAVYYVVARLNMAELEAADAAKASAFTQMFLQSLNAKVSAWTGNNPNLGRLPFAGQPLGVAK